MQLKNVGIFVLLVAIVVIATLINGTFVDPANLKTLVRDTSLYGLISIGVALVIMTGGIDLSIGSVIALCGVMLVQVINIRYEKTDFETKIDTFVNHKYFNRKNKVSFVKNYLNQKSNIQFANSVESIVFIGFKK